MRFAHALDLRDECVAAPTRRRSLAHEPSIGRRADADREQPSAAEPVVNHLHELGFIAHAAVGDEHDLAERVLRRRNGEREIQGGAHFGAAVRNQAVDEVRGGLAVDRHGRLRDGEQDVASLLKRTMLNASPACSRSTPRRNAVRACSIDGPLIEPDVSMM